MKLVINIPANLLSNDTTVMLNINPVENETKVEDPNGNLPFAIYNSNSKDSNKTPNKFRKDYTKYDLSYNGERLWKTISKRALLTEALILADKKKLLNKENIEILCSTTVGGYNMLIPADKVLKEPKLIKRYQNPVVFKDENDVSYFISTEWTLKTIDTCIAYLNTLFPNIEIVTLKN